MSALNMEINPEILSNDQLFRIWLIQTLTSMQNSIDTLKDDTGVMKGVQRDQESRVREVEKVSWKTVGASAAAVVFIDIALNMWKLWH